MTIVEFLTARYDERKRAFQAAGAPYFVDPYDGMIATPSTEWPNTDVEPTLPSRKGEWLPFYDQAEALADLEAKRAIVEHMERRRQRQQLTTSDLNVLCMLASPFSGHADFDLNWIVIPG